MKWHIDMAIVMSSFFSRRASRIKFESQKIQVIVPSPRQTGTKAAKPFDKSDFNYDSGNDVYICPAGEVLSYRRIEDKNKKVYRNCGSFPTADSVRKVIYLALQRISQKWKRPIKDWVAVLNHFSIMFEGRI